VLFEPTVVLTNALAVALPVSMSPLAATRTWFVPLLKALATVFVLLMSPAEKTSPLIYATLRVV
jgi:hypothetical protein